MYLSSKSRPNIQFIVHQCDRFTHNPRKSHAVAVNRICHYLVGTQGKGLTFDPNSDMKLYCYVDAVFRPLESQGRPRSCVSEFKD